MRSFLTFAFASLPFGILAAAFACGSTVNPSTGPLEDGGAEASEAGEIDVFGFDVGTGGYDASGDYWTLANGDDPVLLQTQNQALKYLVQFAYQSGTGVAPGFNVNMPYAPSAPHDASGYDDFGFAAALGQYACSAAFYHNTNTFTPTLENLAPIVVSEANAIATLPGNYDGEIYYQLRNAAIGYQQAEDPTNGNALNAAAEAYVQSILGNYVHQVTLPGSEPDGGSGKKDKDAGGDAGDGGGATTAYVIGTTSVSGGPVTYNTFQAAMAAAALLDMAQRYSGSPDAGTNPAQWQAIGTSVLSYLWNRARDPVTGLFYQVLVTSDDAGHDALAPAGTTAGSSTSLYTPDALLTDVQARISLALARAQAATSSLAGDGGTTTALYASQVVDLAVSLTCLGQPLSASCSGLYRGGDGFLDPVEPPEGGTPPGTFLEGFIPSLSQTLANRTTVGNALLLGASAQASALGGATRCLLAGGSDGGGMYLSNQCISWENAQIRWGLSATQSNGSPWPPNSNLMSAVVVMGQTGQLAFLRATSEAWGFANAFAPNVNDASVDAGLEGDAMRYVTSATSAMIEAMTELWVVEQNAPSCGF